MRRPRPRFHAHNYAQYLANPGSRATFGGTPTGQPPIDDSEGERRRGALAASGEKPDGKSETPRESKIRVGGRTVEVVRTGKGPATRALRSRCPECRSAGGLTRTEFSTR